MTNNYFDEARSCARNLKLKNVAQWRIMCRKIKNKEIDFPLFMPLRPDVVFKNKGWINWSDWLGKEKNVREKKETKKRNYRKRTRGSNMEYAPFFAARNFVRKLNLKNVAEWKKFCRGEIQEKGNLPLNIPICPEQIYSEWNGTMDWLGFAPKFLNFVEARNYIRNLKLESYSEWREYIKGKNLEKGILPKNIPKTPNLVYKNKGWVNLYNWLGIDKPLEWRPFEQAHEFVKSLELKNMQEWRKYVKGEIPEKTKLPPDISPRPDVVYKNQWKGYGFWLKGEGDYILRKTTRRGKNIVSYNKAREFVWNLKLKSFTEWLKYSHGEMPEKGTLPLNIPVLPDVTYRNKGWKNWNDWLGRN